MTPNKMVVDRIRRTGSATSEFRQLIVTQGEIDRVLSTVIVKLKLGPELFRNGKAANPVEQYAFRVRNTVFERFADATAAVMKIHHVELEPNEIIDAQQYVQKAVRILQGKEQLRALQEVPQTAVPARIAA